MTELDPHGWNQLLVTRALEFLDTLTPMQQVDLDAGRLQLTTVEACPTCGHASPGEASCRCTNVDDCVCGPAAVAAAGPSLWRQQEES